MGSHRIIFTNLHDKNGFFTHRQIKIEKSLTVPKGKREDFVR
jgi:hypothetical protein